MSITPATVKQLAFECGFELVGITAAGPSEDFVRFDEWRAHGMAGEMSYLTDRRGDLRSDPRNLLPSAQSMVCVGKLYNTALPYSTEPLDAGQGWISRYAWGEDYHDVLCKNLEHLVQQIAAHHPEPFESRICVDTAPLLERSYARAAGLGWIGKNTCLINQQSGSWFFLGELLLSIPLDCDSPAPERCGTCTRCIDACPTQAIMANRDGTWSVDSRLCISYLTIEKRGAITDELSSAIGNHLFGCDICQDVCPWNGRAPVTAEEAFAPAEFAPSLARLAGLTEKEFRAAFRHSPVWRTKYSGFLRNVAVAIGNSGRREMLGALERLAGHHPDSVVKEAADHAISRLMGDSCEAPE